MKMPDYSGKNIKELEYNYKGYLCYKTILFIADKSNCTQGNKITCHKLWK